MPPKTPFTKPPGPTGPPPGPIGPPPGPTGPGPQSGPVQSGGGGTILQPGAVGFKSQNSGGGRAQLGSFGVRSQSIGGGGTITQPGAVGFWSQNSGGGRTH